MSMGIVDIDLAVERALDMSNQLIMGYVRTSDPNWLLKALELQIDSIRLLQKILGTMNGGPCPN